MGYFDTDLEELLDVYLLETSQLMEKLDEILMEAEQSKNLESEDINHIFRIMHTTKSSSAVMGLGDLSTMAHKLEDLFSMLRDGKSQEESVDKDLFELLFAASDFIKEELSRMKQDDYQPKKPQDIELKIENYLSSFKNPGMIMKVWQKETSSAASTTQESVQIEDEFLNVKIERLDKLQDLTGELMLLAASLKNELHVEGYQNLEEMFMHRINQVLEQLENTVLRMRMVPVASIVPKLKRIIRDISQSQNKKIKFEIVGQEVEADKNIVDHLYEASMHILRNSVDHGIELPEERKKKGKPSDGTIRFTVENTGEELVVSISDDGRGMDEKKLRENAREKQLFTKPEAQYSVQEIYELSTLPGFSTNKETNEYSGRGVGMDIVRKLMEDTGGHLHIDSEKGKGTTVMMYMPFSHTIVDSTLFCAGEQMFSVASHQVYRFFEYSENCPALCWKNGRNVVLYEDKILPIIDLAQFYQIKRKRKKTGVLIYVKGLSKEVCLLADDVITQEKIVIKPLPALLGDRFREKTGMNGCSVAGDGSICMSLDTEILIRSVQREKEREKGG